MQFWRLVWLTFGLKEIFTGFGLRSAAENELAQGDLWHVDGIGEFGMAITVYRVGG